MMNISFSQALRIQKERNAILLDVQLEEDFQKKHLWGNVHIPIERLNDMAPIVFPNKQVPLIVYCQKGIRSRVACDMLALMGYEQIYNLKDGIDSKW